MLLMSLLMVVMSIMTQGVAVSMKYNSDVCNFIKLTAMTAFIIIHIPSVSDGDNMSDVSDVINCIDDVHCDSSSSRKQKPTSSIEEIETPPWFLNNCILYAARHHFIVYISIRIRIWLGLLVSAHVLFFLFLTNP